MRPQNLTILLLLSVLGIMALSSIVVGTCYPYKSDNDWGLWRTYSGSPAYNSNGTLEIENAAASESSFRQISLFEYGDNISMRLNIINSGTWTVDYRILAIFDRYHTSPPYLAISANKTGDICYLDTGDNRIKFATISLSHWHNISVELVDASNIRVTIDGTSYDVAGMRKPLDSSADTIFLEAVASTSFSAHAIYDWLVIDHTSWNGYADAVRLHPDPRTNEELNLWRTSQEKPYNPHQNACCQNVDWCFVEGATYHSYNNSDHADNISLAHIYHGLTLTPGTARHWEGYVGLSDSIIDTSHDWYNLTFRFRFNESKDVSLFVRWASMNLLGTISYQRVLYHQNYSSVDINATITLSGEYVREISENLTFKETHALIIYLATNGSETINGETYTMATGNSLMPCDTIAYDLLVESYDNDTVVFSGHNISVSSSIPYWATIQIADGNHSLPVDALPSTHVNLSYHMDADHPAWSNETSTISWAEISYDYSNVSGIPRFIWYNESSASWEDVPSQLNPSTHIMTANLSHFSEYAVATTESNETEGNDDDGGTQSVPGVTISEDDSGSDTNAPTSFFSSFRAATTSPYTILIVIIVVIIAIVAMTSKSSNSSTQLWLRNRAAKKRRR